MNLFDVNWLAVLVATLIPMAVGFLWYGPLFGKQWLKLMEKTEDEVKENFSPFKAYGMSTIMAFFMSFVTANMINLLDDPGIVGAILLAVLLWQGYMAPLGYQSVAFEGKKASLFTMSMMYNLVTLTLMSIVFVLWP